MKYSIIIPTYQHLNDCLKPCCESIIKYSSFKDTEVIIVGNGCTDGTKEYVLNLSKSYPFKYLDYETPLGYSKAINKGLYVASGEYVILLNNDTQILNSDKDTWLNCLEQPFQIHSDCGITGPILMFSDYIKKEFLVFFCVMISRKALNKVGYLDEVFNEGGGEDCDYCIRANNLGFRLVMVPYNTAIKDTEDFVVGGFPIYHEGERTVSELKNWQEIFDRNFQILKNKYEGENK